MIKFIYKFIRSLFRFLALLILCAVTNTIYVLTYEKGAKGKMTYRKAKRIKRLTKLKIFALDHMPRLMKFLGCYDYLSKLKYRIGYGVQLRDAGTIKRAV